MARKEAKKYKALYFDIRIKAIEEHYSKTNPQGAYRKINYKTTDLEILFTEDVDDPIELI